MSIDGNSDHIKKWFPLDKKCIGHQFLHDIFAFPFKLLLVLSKCPFPSKGDSHTWYLFDIIVFVHFTSYHPQILKFIIHFPCNSETLPLSCLLLFTLSTFKPPDNASEFLINMRVKNWEVQVHNALPSLTVLDSNWGQSEGKNGHQLFSIRESEKMMDRAAGGK